MNIYIALGITMVIAYYVGYLAKKVRLPTITGYMIIGIIMGSSVFNIIDEYSIEKLGFITDIALGFVAFSIGAELSISTIKKQGKGIISIIFAESFAAFFVVTILIYIFTRDMPLALILGAMAPASDPAGTVAVIQEYKSKGKLTKALYAVVGIDDGLAIIIFGFASALAKILLVKEGADADVTFLRDMLGVCGEIMLSLLVGGLIGFIFSRLIRFVREQRDMVILVFSAILIAIGCSQKWHFSLILTNMMIGFIFVNTRRVVLVQKVASQLLNIMPLIFILFFSIAGAHLDISLLPSIGIIGVVYMLGRSIGLIGGARIGATFGKTEECIKKYIGLGILSQAGVAIGLALIVQKEFSAMNSEHAKHIGVILIITTTATSIFFSIIGPILTKIALTKAGEIHSQKKENKHD